MESPELTFSLTYFVVSLCFVLTPNEFRSAGLTVQNLFSPWLGSEDQGFIQYHVRRSSITVLVHSALPLGTNPVYSCLRLCTPAYVCILMRASVYSCVHPRMPF